MTEISIVVFIAQYMNKFTVHDSVTTLNESECTIVLNDVVGRCSSPEQGVMVIIIYSGAKGMYVPIWVRPSLLHI